MKDVLSREKANDTFGIILVRILLMMPTLFVFLFTMPLLWIFGVKHSRSHMSEAANKIVDNAIKQ